MKLRVTVEGKKYEVEVEMLDEGAMPSMNYGPAAVAPVAPAMPAPAAPAPAPAPRVAPMPTPTAATGGGGGVVKAPIVGTVVKVLVKAGDPVSVNQVLLVMEAMKMETNVASPVAGKVKTITVAPGNPVKAGQVLVELE